MMTTLVTLQALPVEHRYILPTILPLDPGPNSLQWSYKVLPDAAQVNNKKVAITQIEA